jgi:hypothetical protein
MTVQRRRPHRVLIGLPLLVAMVVAVIVPASSAVASHKPRITISNVAFAVGQVDVTDGFASVALTWAVADTSPTATQIRGTVTIQQFVGSRQVGPDHTVRYALFFEWPALVSAEPGSTVANSTYRYEFLVPQYGSATNRTWRVTRVTAEDDAGLTKRVSGDVARLAATGLVDTTAPTILFMIKTDTPDPIFDSGAGVTLRYMLRIDEPESGFWKGRVVFAGPGGARVTVPLRLVDRGEPWPYCGDSPVFVLSDVECTIALVVPAGSPSGTWTITSVVLTSTAEVTARAADADPIPIRVTRNDRVSATDFALTPTNVDNWRQPATLTLSLRPTAAQGGLARVEVHTSCWPLTNAPTIAPDGTASIEIQMPTFMRRCDIEGIQLTDGAGNIAVYGTPFGAPALGLVATTTPDTTPPVATAVSMTQTVRLTSDTSPIGVDVTVDDTTGAPINGYSVTFYSTATQASVGGGHGGTTTGPDGVVGMTAHVGGLPAGTYIAGFTLTDAAGQNAFYGYPYGTNPNVRPTPGGPLILTVVEG